MRSERTKRNDPIAEHWSSAAPDQIEGARTRVLNRLQSIRLAPQAPQAPQALQAPQAPQAPQALQLAAWVAAAVVIFAAAVFTGRVVSPLGDGGAPVRSGSSTREITLDDGSRVEMRPDSELSVEGATDGLGINLHRGSIIVNAAKQHGGHLYVRTKDMTVSVVGTVFVVNASEDGSRVGVIEGEVRVREKDPQKIETSLHPGQQVSTNRTRVVPALNDDIAWSRHAEAHLAILASFMEGMASTSAPLTPLKDTPRPLQAQSGQSGANAPAGPSFDEASVRRCDPDNLPHSPIGARGGGANSLMMTPGRLYAQCMTLLTLIRTAYELGPADLEFFRASEQPVRRNLDRVKFDAVYGMGVEDGQVVRAAPEWVRETRYSIEAVGNAAATPAALRGPMLKDLLERRFQLKGHVETEQLPGYALVVGPGGLKGMKPFKQSDCGDEVSDAVKAERKRKGWSGPILMTEAAYFGIKPSCGGVYGESNGPNFHIEFANSTPGSIAGLIGRSMRVRVIDRTNITDRFTFSFDFGIDELTPLEMQELRAGKTWNPKPGWDSPMTIPKAPSILVAPEQLGLKLEPIRVPREFIVIDRVERPSEN